MTYDLQSLQVQFNGLLPLLDDTLAHTKQSKSALSEQDYQRMRIRNANAHLLAHPPEEADRKTISPYEQFVLGAVLFMDLEKAADGLNGEAKEAAREKIDALYQLYDDNGFTDRDVLYGYPVMPVKKMRAETIYY